MPTRQSALFFQTVVVVALGLSLPLNVAGADASRPPATLLEAAIEDACDRTTPDSGKTREPTFQATLVEDSPIIVRGITSGWRRRFNMIDGGTLKIERMAPRGQLRRLSAEYLEPTGAGHRPHMLAVAGPDCLIAAGRRLHYDSEGRQSTLEHLSRDLVATGVTEPLNPPVPSGKDPDGTSVAIVDAGVNYELPEIAARLARNTDGEMLGYDYWELDERPFDVHPVPSIYFPRRHGTRVASVILREAPTARLIPYRYPRPAMLRMKDLVEDASSKGIIIVNLSLGSNNESDWHALEEAIEAHSHMLFIVSAGNNGRDIDADPVYPATLPQPNILTVTSAEVSGDLAPGSNWGPQSVDLLVPGEGLPVLEFNGRTALASGSSYAAARVSALAARLLAEHPQWQADELKEAIVALAEQPVSGESKHVAHGFIADTTVPLQKKALSISELISEERTVDSIYLQQQASIEFTHALTPSFVYFANTRWNRSTILRATRKAAEILAQCGVYVPSVRLHQLDAPERFRDFSVPLAMDLLSRVDVPRPSVFFVRDTLQHIAYDAEAFGQSNTVTRPILRDTVWITEAAPHPGVAVAHELVHILADSGEHVYAPDNLMREHTNSRNFNLTQTQCKRITHVGNRNGLLALLAESQQSHK